MATWLAGKLPAEAFATFANLEMQHSPKMLCNFLQKVLAKNILSMVDMRSNYTKDIFTNVRETYSNSIGIFETYIPMSVKASEISAEGISIYAHCPNSKVAKAYEALTMEVLAK